MIGRASGKSCGVTLVLMLLVFLQHLDIRSQYQVFAAEKEKPYFQGKRITFIVPFSAGGSTDVRARFIAEQLGRYIPGNPQILVNNRTGGGGAIAFNFLETAARPDGLTIGVATSGVLIRWLTGQQGHTYDLEKMKILAAAGETQLAYVGGTLGVKNLADLYGLGRPIRTGHTRITSSYARSEQALKEILGLPFKPTVGYDGYSEARIAVLRGEVDMSWDYPPAYHTAMRPQIESGELVPIFQVGYLHEGKLAADPRIPDMPLLSHQYEERTGKSIYDASQWPYLRAVVASENLGTSFWLPAGVPPDVAAILVDAFEKMAASPEYQAAAVKMMGAEDRLSGAKEAKQAFDTFVGNPKEVVDWLSGPN